MSYVMPFWRFRAEPCSCQAISGVCKFVLHVRSVKKYKVLQIFVCVSNGTVSLKEQRKECLVNVIKQCAYSSCIHANSSTRIIYTKYCTASDF